MHKLTIYSLAMIASQNAVWCKSIDEAMSTITDSEMTDPNGFKLMLICWTLLSLLAGALIIATFIYYMKGKGKK